jgi:hypothetical protein
MGALILGLVVAVAMAATGDSAPAGGLQAESSIRVVSDQYEIDYPRSVHLRLEAEAAEQITEITLFYHLAGRASRVYGYPQFTAGRRVSSEFTIRTGGSDYLPAGVEIEYYYQIRDSQGGVVETPRSKMSYLDPTYHWRELRQGDLIVTWHDIPVERVRSVVTNVEPQLQSVKDMFGLTDVRPVKAVIFNSRRESARGLPFVSEAASQRHLYGGFAFNAYDEFVLSGLTEEGIAHEVTHLLLDQAVTSPLAKVPAWLNEGLATYFEPRTSGRARTVASAARNRGLLRLRSMGAVPGRPDEVGVFYAQSWSIVTHMLETYGPEKMGDLVTVIDSGVEIDDALRRVYGMGTDGLEAEWRAQFVGSVSLAPRPDPGTLSTTLLITGSIAIAAVVSAYRWFMYRRRKPEPEDGEELEPFDDF